MVSPERAAQGERLCATHDEKCKAKTKAAHLLRMRKRGDYAETLRISTEERERLIFEMKELAYFWDGPGSEGRIV